MKKLSTKYVTISVYALAIFSFSVIFLLLCLNIGSVFSAIGSFLSAVGAILYAILFSFLLLPAVKRFDHIYERVFSRKKAHPFLVSGFSIGTTFLLALALVALTLIVVVPVMITDIQDFSIVLGDAFTRLDAFMESSSATYPWLSDIYAKVTALFQTPDGLSSLLGNSFGSAISSTATFLSAAFSQTSNIFLGLIVSIYLLASRRAISGICGKMVVAFLPEKHVNRFVIFFKRLYTDFCVFAFNRALVAFLFSLATFLICFILRVPMASVVFFIIFITHLIPVVGPIVGVTLSGLTVLVLSPFRALFFLLAVLVLEILFTNLVMPHFLPKKLRPSYALTAVLVLIFFALFGAVGAFLAVPVFVSFDIEFRAFLARRLARKKLPISPDQYEILDYDELLKSEPDRIPQAEADASEQDEQENRS